LGDVGPRASVQAGLESYTARGDLQTAGLPLEEARTVLADAFPSGDANLNAELIRTIAILGSTDRLLINKILETITSDSAPPDDIHRLVAISRIQTPRTQQQSAATARALVNLDVKIQRQQLMQDSNWDDRLSEIYDALCNVDPLIPSNIGGQPEFGLPGHVMFMRRIGPDKTQQAIDGFAAKVKADADYEWSPEVVSVLGLSERAEHQELIRGQIENLSIQDAVVNVMSKTPRLEDRSIFLSGIESAKLGTVEASLNALMKLPRNATAAEQYALLAAAKRLNHDKNEFQLREMAIRLLQNNLSQGFAFVFGEAGHMPQAEALTRWTELLTVRYPDYVPPLAGGQDAAEVLAMLENVAWDMGDASRGKTLFTKLSCARCHGGRKALGPDLQGVSKRFARTDLFASIVDPNRDVSSRYQLTTVETTSGKTYSGLVVYESVDGIMLRDAEQNTFRIEAADIETKVLRRVSLMPNGLLKNVSAEDLADLNAYMESL
jgi:putative heme-binding domain-containing protein